MDWRKRFSSIGVGDKIRIVGVPEQCRGNNYCRVCHMNKGKVGIVTNLKRDSEGSIWLETAFEDTLFGSEHVHHIDCSAFTKDIVEKV